MRFLTTLLIFLFFSFHMAGQPVVKEIVSFGTNPGNLKMYTYIPAWHPDSLKNRPLVVVLHGCYQCAETVAIESGWNKLADLYGFCVIYPQQKIINNASVCFNWFRKKDISGTRGEVFSIKEMVEFALDSFCSDRRSVFVYGLSAGAATSVALMANYPGLFRAGAILAGGPYMAATNPFSAMGSMIKPKDQKPEAWAKPILNQNPDYKEPYPRMVIIHGTKDQVVDIRNAYALISQWSVLHHTDTIPDKVVNQFDGHPDITKSFFCDSAGNDVILFYKVQHLGHALLINPGSSEKEGGHTGVFAVDKNFHSTWWIATDFGLTGKER